MNWVDIAVLTVVAFSALLGFMRGMVREVLGLAAWIGAGFAATWFFPQFQGVSRRLIENQDIADPVTFGVIFLVVLIVFSLVARAVGGAVRGSVLGGLDRTLGLVYGLARGAALMIAAYLIAGVVLPVDRWPDQVLEARTLPLIYNWAGWVSQRLPADYRPALPVPPTDRPTSSADLLHAAPLGRALGVPPPRP
jgi:membrane protein required for colicin V production